MLFYNDMFGSRLGIRHLVLTKSSVCCTFACVILYVACDVAAQEVRRHREQSGDGIARVTHGPILGRPGAHQMGVWVRTSRPTTFQVRYGRDAERFTVLSASVATQLEKDCTGWTLLQNLQADTLYHYQIVGVDTAEEQIIHGSFHTLPDDDEYCDAARNPEGLFNFSFEFACGNHQRHRGMEKQFVPAFATILKNHGHKIHFSIQNGDWLYEDYRKHSVAAWREAMRISERETPRLVSVAPMLVGVCRTTKCTSGGRTI